jgi:hypothetical protein
MATENGPTSTPDPGSEGEPFEEANFGMKKTPQPGEKADEAKPSDDEDFWTLFGINPPNFSDMWEQEKAPPVDRQLLRRYCQSELTGEEQDRVARLVVNYKTWWDAAADVSVELARERSQSESPDK